MRGEKYKRLDSSSIIHIKGKKNRCRIDSLLCTYLVNNSFAIANIYFNHGASRIMNQTLKTRTNTKRKKEYLQNRMN